MIEDHAGKGCVPVRFEVELVQRLVLCLCPSSRRHDQSHSDQQNRTQGSQTAIALQIPGISARY
jgi:hypothetical protein